MGRGRRVRRRSRGDAGGDGGDVDDGAVDDGAAAGSTPRAREHRKGRRARSSVHEGARWQPVQMDPTVMGDLLSQGLMSLEVVDAADYFASSTGGDGDADGDADADDHSAGKELGSDADDDTHIAAPSKAKRTKQQQQQQPQKEDGGAKRGAKQQRGDDAVDAGDHVAKAVQAKRPAPPAAANKASGSSTASSATRDSASAGGEAKPAAKASAAKKVKAADSAAKAAAAPAAAPAPPARKDGDARGPRAAGKHGSSSETAAHAAAASSSVAATGAAPLRKWEIDPATIPTLDADRMSSWSVFGVHDKILLGLQEAKFFEPTAIQRDSMLAGIRDRLDVCGIAETGSGKTLAFGVCLLNGILRQLEAEPEPSGVDASAGAPSPLRAIVLSPTRELAVQIAEHLRLAGKYTGIRVRASEAALRRGVWRVALTLRSRSDSRSNRRHVAGQAGAHAVQDAAAGCRGDAWAPVGADARRTPSWRSRANRASVASLTRCASCRATST